MVINSNTTAIITNNYLQRSENRLSKSMQRLSSGNKINNASDNPAGYAISSRMRAQLRSLEKASDNASEGIDFIQTAEGALTEVHDMIQRMNEISVKAANGTLSDSDRQAIQDEIEQLCGEINRLATETEFNGQKMLNGYYEQRGYTDQEQVKVLGYSDKTENGVLKLSFSVETETRSRQISTVDADGNNVDETVIYDVVSKIEVHSEDPDPGSYSERFANKFNSPQSSISYDPENFIVSMKAADGTELNLQIEPSHINGDYDADGNIYEMGHMDNSAYYENGVDITLMKAGAELLNKYVSNDNVDCITIDLTGLGTMRVQVGGYQGQVIDMNIPEISLTKLDLANIDVRVPGGALKAIDRLDYALDYTSAVRSKLGAYQNRMEHTINSLDINEESTTRSYATITDTDMATEMTEYSTLQVLQQAATTMLAQANEFPQQALQLLQ